MSLLNAILSVLPHILAAVLIGVAGWFIAWITRLIVTKLLRATEIDQISERVGLNRAIGVQSVSWWIGTIVYVLVLILTTIPALDALGVSMLPIIEPIVSLLLNIPGAVLIGVAGWFIARITRLIVTKLLRATEIDQISERIGLSRAIGSQGLSWWIGNIIYVLMLIPPTMIAALSALGVEEMLALDIAVLTMLTIFVLTWFSWLCRKNF